MIFQRSEDPEYPSLSSLSLFRSEAQFQPRLFSPSSHSSLNQQQQQPAQQAAKMSVDEIMSAIEKLGKMKEAGLITQEEFDAKKKDLLAKM